MKKTPKTPTVADPGLPPDIRAADLKYPAMGRSLPWVEGRQDTLTFYHCSFGWVLCTLLISAAGRRRSGVPDRYYTIGISDKKVYTVGLNPRVKSVVVYVSKNNVDRLAKYQDLHTDGLALAGQIRDRTSSRRAQGQLYRQQGRTSWTW